MNFTIIEVLFFLAIILFFVKKLSNEFEDDIKIEQSKKKIVNIKLVDNDVSVLSKIKEIDNNFSELDFLEGAKEAFKLIVTAFNDSDIESIKNYVSKDIYKSFDEAISKREASDITTVFELVSFEKINLKDMKLTGNIASVTVEFITEQVNFSKDKEGKLVNGTENFVNKVTDIWTFSKDLKSKDPNWTLITTQNV